MPSNHLILCCSLLLLPSIFTSIRVFSSELALHISWPKYWRFSFSISLSNAYSTLSEVIIYKIIKIKLETKCIFCINFHLVAQMVKNLPAMQEIGSIPVSGRSTGEGNGTHSSLLAWRIPWAEEPGGLQSMGRKESDRMRQHYHFHFLNIAVLESMLLKAWSCRKTIWWDGMPTSYFKNSKTKRRVNS